MITVVLVIAIIAVCAVGTTAWAATALKEMAPPLPRMMEPTYTEPAKGQKGVHNEHSKGHSRPVH